MHWLISKLNKPKKITCDQFIAKCVKSGSGPTSLVECWPKRAMYGYRDLNVYTFYYKLIGMQKWHRELCSSTDMSKVKILFHKKELPHALVILNFSLIIKTSFKYLIRVVII